MLVGAAVEAEFATVAVAESDSVAVAVAASDSVAVVGAVAESVAVVVAAVQSVAVVEAAAVVDSPELVAAPTTWALVAADCLAWAGAGAHMAVVSGCAAVLVCIVVVVFVEEETAIHDRSRVLLAWYPGLHLHIKALQSK